MEQGSLIIRSLKYPAYRRDRTHPRLMPQVKFRIPNCPLGLSDMLRIHTAKRIRMATKPEPEE